MRSGLRAVSLPFGLGFHKRSTGIPGPPDMKTGKTQVRRVEDSKEQHLGVKNRCLVKGVFMGSSLPVIVTILHPPCARSAVPKTFRGLKANLKVSLDARVSKTCVILVA